MFISKFQILSFNPHTLEKPLFWEKLYKILFCWIKERNICHRTSSLLPTCQLLRKSINIWYSNGPKIFDNYVYRTFAIKILEVFDNWQIWKWYRWLCTGKLNLNGRAEMGKLNIMGADGHSSPAALKPQIITIIGKLNRIYTNLGPNNQL